MFLCIVLALGMVCFDLPEAPVVDSIDDDGWSYSTPAFPSYEYDWDGEISSYGYDEET